MSRTAQIGRYEVTYEPVTHLVSYDRARIEGEGVFYNNVRFIFSDGNTAVWEIGRKTATRIHLFSGATFEKSNRRKVPDLLTLPDGTEWAVRFLGNDCGCRKSPFAGTTPTQLLEPSFSTTSTDA